MLATLARRHTPHIISALILVLIVADAARLVWSASGPAIPEVTDPPRLTSLRPPVRSALPEIRRGHLFGIAPAAQSVGAAAAAADWVLHGTFATNDPDNGYAIIERRPQGDRLWRAGARISAHERLYRVYRDHVLLEVDGRLQTLSLPRTVNGSFVPLVAAAAPADEGAGDSQQVTFGSSLLPRETVGESWFDRLRPFTRPATDGTEGFVMRVTNDRSGFEDGDVVTAVNGHPVQSADSASRWLQQDASGSISFTVERDGQPQTVNIDLGQ